MRNVVAERFIELLVIESYRPLSNQELVELAESFHESPNVYGVAYINIDRGFGNY